MFTLNENTKRNGEVRERKENREAIIEAKVNEIIKCIKGKKAITQDGQERNKSM